MEGPSLREQFNRQGNGGWRARTVPGVRADLLEDGVQYSGQVRCAEKCLAGGVAVALARYGIIHLGDKVSFRLSRRRSKVS